MTPPPFSHPCIYIVMISRSTQLSTESPTGPMAVFRLPSVTVPSPSQPMPSRHLSPQHSLLRRFNNSFPPLLRQISTTTPPTTLSSTTSFFSKGPRSSGSVNVAVRSQLRYPMVSPNDHWGIWSTLFATGAFGLW